MWLLDMWFNINNYIIFINALKRRTPSKNFNEKKQNINCHATARKQINNQTTNKNVTMINAIDEVFSVHRRFVLKIALKIDDRKKNENFIAVAANEANETNEKINKWDYCYKRNNKKNKNKTIIVDDETIINKKNVAIAKLKYLTKIFSTTLMIIIFNSWNWFFENFEVMMFEFR